MSTEGPFLYDEGPEQLHTGTPRRRQGLLLAVFGGTVLVAVLMVVLLPLVKGSAGDQAGEVVQVFLAALDKGDNETAYQLLCEKERADLAPDDVAARYLGGDGTGEVAGVTDGEVDHEPVHEVSVRWSDGRRSTFSVINEDGASVCGTAPAP